MKRKFPFYRQHDQMDCGPTCLRIIAKYYGREYSMHQLRSYCNIGKTGTSLLGISEGAEKIGLHSSGIKLKAAQLEQLNLPCVLHWQNRHFVVLYKIHKEKYYVSDPAQGLVCYTKQFFLNNWLVKKNNDEGVGLFISPGTSFLEKKTESSRGLTLSGLWKYRKVYSKLIAQLLFGLGIGSILQLILPLLTQAIVDTGIPSKDINFITLILIAQFMLFIGTSSVNFLRSWIMLHMTTRLNVTILSDFLAKLMRLPMSFFDSRRTGDIMQRMNDHNRIESFLTSTTLNTLFSITNLVVYSLIVAYYNKKILLIFAICTAIYTGWILVFMRRRRELDQQRFDNSSNNQSSMVELINGIQEIKLHNCEKQKRFQWENIQAKLFKFSLKSLALNQYQQAGASFINQVKNILIIYLSARAVIQGDMTLGGMMALQFMAGQLNAPIEQLLSLIQGYQDARISLERLNEVHGMEDEEAADKKWRSTLPDDLSIRIENLTYRYPGAGNEPVLENLNLFIPKGKTTAIVGLSGSGKTTLLKLLLRFYLPENGQIWIGNTKLDTLSFKEWRRHCGVVMQDGFIFSDTIAANIAVGDESPDPERLEHAITMANIKEFIDELPLGLETVIGTGGNGISQGQKQRLFIARAIYKDPQYIFFDEATNSLDSNNETVIMNNLADFFAGRTVVVVAHRLSTVRKADNIIVLDKGRISEQGTHQELTFLRKYYYSLVKNQFELSC